MIHNSENEIQPVKYENFNQKFLTNNGVCCYFGNVFLPSESGKLPVIKSKLRKILVDFGLVQTCLEINQQLGYIKVWYRDEQATELKGLLLQRFNQSKESQAIEINIGIEGQSCSPPKISRAIRTYTGLTKLLFQEFIQPIESRSLIDDSPYNQMKELIKQGNISPQNAPESIFGKGVD